MIRPSPFLKNKDRWLLQSEHCVVYESDYPVTKGHALVVPKREIENFQELNDDEWSDIRALTNQYIKDSNALGFNFGLNGGKVAGQTVAHIHFHIFPYFKDTPAAPKGGYCNIFDNLPDYYK